MDAYKNAFLMAYRWYWAAIAISGAANQIKVRDTISDMKTLLLLCIVLSFALVGCQVAAQQQSAGGDPLTGIWVGDFGNGYFDGNTITLDLKWDGKKLTGTVKPGDPGGRMYRNFTPFPIENAVFDARTGAVKFEALFAPRERNYVIEGKVNGDTIAGTWNRPTERRSGDFKLTHQKAN
jgi:hypothetical protein